MKRIHKEAQTQGNTRGYAIAKQVRFLKTEVHLVTKGDNTA